VLQCVSLRVTRCAPERERERGCARDEVCLCACFREKTGWRESVYVYIYHICIYTHIYTYICIHIYTLLYVCKFSVSMCCSVLQCVAVYCSVLLCVAVCCSVS